MTRIFLPGVLVLLLIGCRTPQTLPPAPVNMNEELLALDRAYCAAVQEHGLEAWASHYAEDGAKLELGKGIVVGPAAVTERDVDLFADPAIRLRWEPVAAHTYAGGTHGVTTGRWRFAQTSPTGEETELATGSYVTVWRRGPDGWKVILDTGAPDPPESR